MWALPTTSLSLTHTHKHAPTSHTHTDSVCHFNITSRAGYALAGLLYVETAGEETRTTSKRQRMKIDRKGSWKDRTSEDSEDEGKEGQGEEPVE